MSATTYNVDAFNKHQSSRLKESIMLDKKEQHEILRYISELKDMYENDELKQEGKGNIILSKLNGIGSIIANK
jgi:hypothetical protein